ncbi:MOSC domain-containing protein [Cordyceps javanica]|uniref:MOSC domain-containing protein n=1 Tax=Cordyceps javanica TaxID=43265 RepID=A0A545V398_9HYPO|nr:MOSC domain-containing protein [Cordyceps javanica]TQW07484.1 MOSC domain-containing protein [Cordyceps javanica]
MKVTALYVYPVKALCGIRLDTAEVGGQGLQYDRTFMVCRFGPDGELIKIQMSEHADCALFHQEIVDHTIRVRYGRPEEPVVTHHALQDTVLEFPVEPGTDGLERAEMNLHQSIVSAYRMGPQYDDWFTACFGFKTTLLYIGRERRPVLGTFSPRNPQQPDEPAPQKGWLSSVSSYITGTPPEDRDEPDWLTFSDCAPLLVATEASLRNVRARVASGDVDMLKFRPNIVVDGAAAWDEDFWAALSLNGAPALLLTKLCNRCTSLNVDYRTGRYGRADQEQGTILKVLMRDRRVDQGHKYAPAFGRYGFLDDGVRSLRIAVGDEIAVTRRTEERPHWDWPLRPKVPSVARYYRYAA